MMCLGTHRRLTADIGLGKSNVTLVTLHNRLLT